MFIDDIFIIVSLCFIFDSETENDDKENKLSYSSKKDLVELYFGNKDKDKTSNKLTPPKSTNKMHTESPQKKRKI